MPKASRRITEIPTPMIHGIMERARQLTAEGRDITSLAQAVPDFPVPTAIHERVRELCSHPRYNGYSPDPGLDELRLAISSRLSARDSCSIQPAEILITPGANGAYAALIPAIAGQGDEIILPSPVYMNHKMAVQIAGATPVEVSTDESLNYALDPNAIEAAITGRTVAITLVSPNNPTGAVYRRPEIEAVAEIAKKHNLWIIADEVYEHLILGDTPHIGLNSITAAQGRTVLIGSFSKSHGLTGWRCGYLAAPASIIQQILKVHDTFFICAPVISQLAALEALRIGTEFLEPYRATLRQRRDALRIALGRIRILHWREPDGALFAFVRYDYDMSPQDLAMDLLERTGIAVIPGSAFGEGGCSHLRISFGAASVERIYSAGDRLREYFKQ